MAQELAAAKRERDFYLSRVDRAKALDAMQQRRQAKQQQQRQEGGGVAAGAGADGAGVGAGAAAAAAAGGGGGVDGDGGGVRGVKRLYGQRTAKPDPAAPGAAAIADDVLGLLVAPKSKKQRSGS